MASKYGDRHVISHGDWILHFCRCQGENMHCLCIFAVRSPHNIRIEVSPWDQYAALSVDWTVQPFKRRAVPQVLAKSASTQGFIISWMRNHPWLFYDNIKGGMFCKLCTKYNKGSLCGMKSQAKGYGSKKFVNMRCASCTTTLSPFRQTAMWLCRHLRKCSAWSPTRHALDIAHWTSSHFSDSCLCLALMWKHK